MNLDKKVIEWILKLAVGSLAAMVLGMVFALLVALFVPNEMVDNKDVFPIIGPAFNTVIGAFVGLLGGLSMQAGGGSNDKKKDEDSNEEDKPDQE